MSTCLHKIGLDTAENEPSEVSQNMKSLEGILCCCCSAAVPRFSCLLRRTRENAGMDHVCRNIEGMDHVCSICLGDMPGDTSLSLETAVEGGILCLF